MKNETQPDAKTFANLVNLLSVYAEAKARLDELQAETQTSYLDLVDEKKKEYAELQDKLNQAEESIEVIARANPQWFTGSRTVKTPFGSVALRKSTSLEIPNEELSVALVEQREDADKLLRSRKELDLEALEKLDDEELKRLKIRRVTEESCTVKALKIDLGKAVKSAAEKEGQ